MGVPQECSIFPKKKTNNDNKMEGIRCFFPTALLTINSHFQLFLIRKVLFSIASSFFKLNLFKKKPTSWKSNLFIMFALRDPRVAREGRK